MCQRNPPVVVQRFQDELQREMEQASILADFLDKLNAPTPAQLWLEQASAQIKQWREEDARQGNPWGQE